MTWCNMRFSYVVFFSFVRNLFFFFFLFFLFLEQILPNFFYLSFSWPTSISFRYQRCQVFYHILICGKCNQAALSCLWILKKYLSFKSVLLQFRLIFNSQKKKRKERKKNKCNARWKGSNFSCMITFHRVRLETATSCRREWLWTISSWGEVAKSFLY